MVNFVPVGGGRHADKAWRRPPDFAFASGQAVVPLMAAEFARAALSLPIGFIEQAGLYVPVAVMSPVSGRNLFIGPAGQWLGTYVPAALRSYPFCLRRIESADRVTLCIDEDSGLVVEADGAAEDFLDADGNPSPTMKSMFDFLVAIEQSRTLTVKVAAALADAGLMQQWQFQVTMDGRMTPANGLFRIDEAALNALDDTTFLTLRRVGALPLAYLQLVSMGQIAVLDQLNLAQQQLAHAHQQQRQISSLDELFANASNDTLRFN